MNAAIYARKSTDQSDRSEDAKSVTRQVERAREFAASGGWTIADEHIYKDENVSGAEFDRPGLTRLLTSLSQKPLPFQVLIVIQNQQ